MPILTANNYPFDILHKTIDNYQNQLQIKCSILIQQLEHQQKINQFENAINRALRIENVLQPLYTQIEIFFKAYIEDTSPFFQKALALVLHKITSLLHKALQSINAKSTDLMYVPALFYPSIERFVEKLSHEKLKENVDRLNKNLNDINDIVEILPGLDTTQLIVAEATQYFFEVILHSTQQIIDWIQSAVTNGHYRDCTPLLWRASRLSVGTQIVQTFIAKQYQMDLPVIRLLYAPLEILGEVKTASYHYPNP